MLQTECPYREQVPLAQTHQPLVAHEQFKSPFLNMPPPFARSYKNLLPYEVPSHWPSLGYVRRHPEDTSVYPKVVRTKDPLVWRPKPADWKGGRVKKWGILDKFCMQEDDDCDPTIKCIGRVMQNERQRKWYGLVAHDSPQPPLEQFIHILEAEKRKFIKKDCQIKNVMKMSLVVKINLTHGCEAVWRRILVPASIALPIFHDQVLAAVMGWYRGYHAYVFEDPTDGTVFGPSESSGLVDMMHSQMRYHHVAEDKRIPLAALLREVGDICYYTYDLGDRWEHKLQVEEVVYPIPSYHEKRVFILDGECACPPEDGVGLRHSGLFSYGNFLREFREDPGSKKEVIAEVEADSMNYACCNVGKKRYRPLHYDINYRKLKLEAALAGPFVEKTGYHNFRETFARCHVCGDRLRPLLHCSRCKKVSYCTRDCQKVDWPHHRLACKK